MYTIKMMSNEQYEQFNGANEYADVQYVGVVYDQDSDIVASMHVLESEEVKLLTSIDTLDFISVQQCIEYLNETFCVVELS